MGRGLEEKAVDVGTRAPPSLMTARPSEDVYDVLRRMRARGIRHVLITDEAGKLVGVVSIRDLIEDKALRNLGERVWYPPPED